MENIVCIILVRAIFIKKCHLCVPLPTSLQSLQLSAIYWHELCNTVKQLLCSWAVLICHHSMQIVYIKWPRYALLDSRKQYLTFIEIICTVTIIIIIIIWKFNKNVLASNSSISKSNYCTATWLLLFCFSFMLSFNYMIRCNTAFINFNEWFIHSWL